MKRASRSRRGAGAVLLVAWATLHCVGARAEPPARSPSEPATRPVSDPAAALDAALAVPALRGARVGALVVDRSDGRVLYAHQPDRALMPASNQKILTALAALATFGPSHRFTTWLGSDAPLDAEGSVGTLYVRGGGDPALTSEDWFRLAADLRRAGLARVGGDVVLDDAIFDRVGWHPGWKEVSSRAFHAPVGGLEANYGAFAVEVRPGSAPGRPVRVALDPPVPYLAALIRATTGKRGSGRSLAIGREPREGGDLAVVSGSIAAGAEPELAWRSVSDPALYAGSVLVWQLGANGIAVGGRVRRGTVPPDAVELLAFEGRSLAEIVRLFVKYSNNAVAESLVKAMGVEASGPPGSWGSGMAALRERLQALGLDLGEAELVDGSGLSRDNHVPPRLLVEALRTADRSFAFGPEFVAALPIAGADGTLRKRAEENAGAFRAKTGHLDGVNALSGYARLGSGREAVFSLIANGDAGNDDAAMRALDGFVRALPGALGSSQESARSVRRTE